jgi:hypothetical protein
MLINVVNIQYFGRPCNAVCDRKCNKAWGINTRPKVQLSEDGDGDDYAFLADNELGEAPADPGTYEGTHGKPSTPDHFPNKWCIRECERCEKTGPDDLNKPLKLLTFEKRFYNIYSHDPDYQEGER